MDPNQQPNPYNTPPQAPGQVTDPLAGYGTVPQAAGSGTYSAPPPPAPGKKSKLPFIIAGAVVALLLIVALVVVLMSSNKPASSTKTQVKTTDIDESSFLKPATAVGAEQTSNSISQDLSGLNDDTDFPATKIDDKALGL